MSDLPIKVEVYRFYAKQPDEMFPTFKDAAIAAANACDLNTSWYGTAENIETGKKWTRDQLLRVGYSLIVGADTDE